MWDHKSKYYYITANIEVNQFYHVVMTFDKFESELKLFVNGNYIGKSTIEGKPKRLVSNNLHIGMASFERNKPLHQFKGFISECGVWDYPLKDTEITKVYNTGIYKDYYTTSDTPIGYWNFESGYDNIIFDTSK